MESKFIEQIDADLLQLELDVEAFLGFEIGIDKISDVETENGVFTSDITRQLLEAEPPQCPEVFLLWRKLNLYAKAGTTPFLLQGGYMDQPYLLSMMFESCETASQRFWANHRQSYRPQQENEPQF